MAPADGEARMLTDLITDLGTGYIDSDWLETPTARRTQLRSAEPVTPNHGPNCGERALLRAVLHDAIVCLTGEGVPKRERARVAAEARRWIRSRSRAWIFAFESICDVLDIEPSYLRKLLLRVAPDTAHDGGGARTSAQPSLSRRLRRVRMRGNQHLGELHHPGRRNRVDQARVARHDSEAD